MTNRYRIFKRKGVYYSHENDTGRQRSLRTRDRQEAERLIHAANEASRTSLINRELGRVYLAAADPELPRRTWTTVMEDYCKQKVRDSTQDRKRRAMQDRAFDSIRHKPIVETTSDDLLKVLEIGRAATNHFLRRLHNHALGMGWLNWSILAPKRWPRPQPRSKRAITEEEHRRIVETEVNAERRLYYEMLWQTGGSQSDIAGRTAEHVDWDQRVLWFHRQKLKPDAQPARISIGPKLEALLRQLPASGPLFPYWGKFDAKARSAEFSRRCRVLGIKGVSLHCYRTAWAERAYRVGYPERFAHANLGHASRAVHQAYARKAKVITPSLEDYEESAAQRAAPAPEEASQEQDDPSSESKVIQLFPLRDRDIGRERKNAMAGSGKADDDPVGTSGSHS